MTTVEVGAIGGPFLILLGILLKFTSSCLKDMPMPAEAEECERGCRPPMLMPHYFNNFSWRCGECGMKWKIQVDVTRPRRDYRQWVPR